MLAQLCALEEIAMMEPSRFEVEIQMGHGADICEPHPFSLLVRFPRFDSWVLYDFLIAYPKRGAYVTHLPCREHDVPHLRLGTASSRV